MHRPRPTSLPPLFAFLAAVVLLLGLPRQLVYCDHGGGDAHLALSHPEGACCTNAGDAQTDSLTLSELPPQEPGGKPEAASAHDPCHHTGFPEDWLPAGHSSPRLPCALPIGPTHSIPELAPALPRGRRFAQATGPPRPDPRLEARATIRMQI